VQVDARPPSCLPVRSIYSDLFTGRRDFPLTNLLDNYDNDGVCNPAGKTLSE